MTRVSTDQAINAYRSLREDGKLDALLVRLGADPEAVEAEAARVASTDATIAEAYVLGLLVGANAAHAIALILEIPTTDPTVPTGPRRVRPGIRRPR